VEALLERGLPGLLRVGQRGGVHVDDHLVPLAPRVGIQPAFEGGLRHQGQGVGLLLARRRRLRLGLGRLRRGPPPLVERLARRVEGLHQQRAHLGLEPPAHDDHPVLVRIHLERPPGVARRGLLGFELPVHSPPRPHDALDVRGRAGLAHRQELRFGVRRGHARQGADLRVGQLPARQRGGKPGQPAQRPRHAHALPRRSRVEPGPPAQPLRAGAAPLLRPAATGVELADQGQEPGGGGVEVRRESSDLVAELVEVGETGR